MTDSQPTPEPTSDQPSTPARLGQLKLALLILASLAAGFLGGWLGAESQGQQSQLDVERQAQIISDESELINNVADRVGASVVSVNVVALNAVPGFFGSSQAFEQASAGTGIILNQDGVVVTNRHVVPENVSQVSVVLSDGTELDNVEVIGRTGPGDPLDIAFLRINDREGHDLVPAELGKSADVEVGDMVIAIGNALGQFQNTVTSGIISGYGRSVAATDAAGQDAETLQNLFQTDAAINQGNSGGPLVDVNGKVIGINTAVAGRAENIGFAIPIDDVKGLIESVLESGKVERPYLGIRYLTLTDDLAETYELDVKRGAFILPEDESPEPSILPDSPAAQAGLQPGDVITKVNGDEVNERQSLTSLIGRHRVGEEITLTVVRGGQTQEIKVKLAAQG